MPLPTEKFVEVDGTRTRYFEAGTGEPMLLLHGGNSGDPLNVDLANNWDLNWDGFARSFRVFAIDRLGQGYTDNAKPAGYTIEAIIAHIRGFIARMGLERLHIVGHSRGGYMATETTRAEQGRILSLTIVDSSTLAPGENVLRLPLLAGAPRPLRTRESLTWVTRAFSASDSLIRKEWMDVRVAVAETARNAAAVAEFEKSNDAVFMPSFRKNKEETLDWIRGGGLKVPTLLVWGKNDPSAVLSGGLALFDIVAGSVQRSQMHIFNHAGHYCYREHPDDFVRVVTAFTGK